MGIYSTAHLVFGVPVNEEDHPKLFFTEASEFEEADIYGRFDELALQRVAFASYGHYEYSEREEVILTVKGWKSSFSGEPYEAGKPLRFGLNPEISGPSDALGPEEPSFKDVVNATDELIGAGIDNVDFRDAAWYLVVSIG